MRLWVQNGRGVCCTAVRSSARLCDVEKSIASRMYVSVVSILVFEADALDETVDPAF